MFEKKVNIYDVFEIRGRFTCYFGVGAIKKMKDIAEYLSKNGVKRVLIVTGKSSYKELRSLGCGG
jgi:alcohol dehydrogenase class IV